jgi:hypothetical protein
MNEIRKAPTLSVATIIKNEATNIADSLAQF